MKMFTLFLLLPALIFSPCALPKKSKGVSVSFDGKNYKEYAIFNVIKDKSDNETYYEYFCDQTQKGSSPCSILYSLSPRLSGDLQLFASKNDVKAVDAVLSFDKINFTAPFSFTMEKQGKKLDEYQTIKDIFYKLDKDEKIVICPVFTDVYPSITQLSLKEKTVKLSCFSTSYKTSAPNRCKNVELACKRINGTVLQPGQTFSFNKATRARTKENGYYPATVINNGEYVSGIGGGVCQVSTTLYNAVKNAGLKVTERYVHTLPPSYVEQGADATVSDYMDFKFMNDSSENVYVVAYTQNKILTVTLYGKR